jgi:hypothetical protein
MSNFSPIRPVQAKLILAVSVLAMTASILWAIQCGYTVTVEMTLPNRIYIEGRPTK